MLSSLFSIRPISIGFTSFLRELCFLKNTLSRAPRGLAPTKHGVSRTAARDKRESSNANRVRI